MAPLPKAKHGAGKHGDLFQTLFYPHGLCADQHYTGQKHFAMVRAAPPNPKVNIVIPWAAPNPHKVAFWPRGGTTHPLNLPLSTCNLPHLLGNTYSRHRPIFSRLSAPAFETTVRGHAFVFQGWNNHDFSYTLC